MVKDDLHIVSVNGGNAKRVRKIVSAGKVSEVMTFAVAAKRLDGKRFSELRDDPMSPLHVRPVIEGGDLKGYRHVSREHLEDNLWISDLTSKPEKFSLARRTIRLKPGVAAQEAFDRDCCMLLDNAFIAQGEGISFDEEAVDILKAAQPDVKGIDTYALFGLDSIGQVNGLRGRFLEIAGNAADHFLVWLQNRAQRVKTSQFIDASEHVKRTCRPQVLRRKHGIC